MLLAFIIFFPPLALGASRLYPEIILELAILALFSLYLAGSFKRGAIEYRKTPLNLFFAALILYSALQLLSGLSKYSYGTLQSIRSAAVCFMLFLAVAATVDTAAKIDRLFSSLTLAGFFVSVIGVLQALTKTDKIYWMINVQNKNFFGPFINENSFACYTSVVSLVTLGSIFSSIYNWKRIAPGMPVKEIILRFADNILNGKTLFRIFAFSLMAYSVFLSRSRSAMIFLAVSMLVFLVFSFRRYKKTIAAAILGALAAYLLLGRFGMGAAAARLSTVTGPDAYVGRAMLYTAGLNILRDYPVFGIGFGAFSAVFPMYNFGMEIVFFRHLHNEFLQFLIEGGWAGLIIVGAPLAIYFSTLPGKLSRLSDSYRYCVGLSLACAFLYLGLHGLTDFQFRINAISSLSVILLAMAVSVAGSESRRITLGFGNKLAVIIVTALLFFMILKPLAVSALAASGRIGAMNLALKIEPTNPDIYIRYSDFTLDELDKGRISKEAAFASAAKAVDRAISLNPYTGEYRIAKARIYFLQYDYSRAFEILRTAALAEPNNSRVHLAYAYMLFWKAIGETDSVEKNRLLKKGLIYYKRASGLSKHTNLGSVVKDKSSYNLLKNALKEEGIEVI